MNYRQQKLLYIFFTLTLVIVVLDRLLVGAVIVNYIKYATVVALFLFALTFKKKHREQLYMNIAMFFMVIADYFFVFSVTKVDLNEKTALVGAGAFLLAYLFLILAFQPGFQVGGREILAGLLVLILFIPNYITLWPHVTGLMLYGGTFFSLVLCYLCWTCIGTLFRNHYKLQVSCRIAVAGCLILIGDMGVAQSFFNPAFQHQFNPGLANLVWATYLPAWTLIATVIAEDNPLAKDA